MRSMEQSQSEHFHKTKLLLQIYRSAVWRMEEDLKDAGETIYYLGGRHLSRLIDFLSFEIDEYDSEKDKKSIEEKLLCISESRDMIAVVDKALAKLKNYPDNGEVYFQILHETYISKKKITRYVLQDKLLISNTTFYRYMNQAINMLGIILWGYILPELRDIWSYPVAAENPHSQNEKQVRQEF